MAKMRNLLAFDLGASNGRAILGQFDGEKITMTELHRFENNYVEMNGVYYWDTPYLYNQLKQGLLAFKQGGFGQLHAFGIVAVFCCPFLRCNQFGNLLRCGCCHSLRLLISLR